MQEGPSIGSEREYQERGFIRAIVRRIVKTVAQGQKYHLQVIFSDGSAYQSTQLGSADITIIFRNRAAEWRMVLGGMFEFLEAYFEGEIDIIGEHALRRLVNIGYRKPFGRIEHPLTWIKRQILERRQNNLSFAQARRNATFHYGLPTEVFQWRHLNACADRSCMSLKAADTDLAATTLEWDGKDHENSAPGVTQTGKRRMAACRGPRCQRRNRFDREPDSRRRSVARHAPKHLGSKCCRPGRWSDVDGNWRIRFCAIAGRHRVRCY